jgi:tRNA(fMet)-specific endonuclease VapC
MKRFLLDTGPAQDFIADRHGVRRRADDVRKAGHRVGICMPVLGELWAGVEGSASRERNLQRLRHGLSRLILWPYDERAAAEYGRMFTELKRKGRPMQQIDMMVAAIALTLGDCTVVSTDGDMNEITGLTVENWATS